MQMKELVVTPETAAEWLKKNTRNRKLSPARVRELADEMQSGNWKLNGETIVFSASGTLLDGQHRLEACVKSGMPFKTIVISGPSDDVFDTIDVNRVRRAKDALDIAGETNTGVLGRVLTLIWKYEHNYLGNAVRYPNNRQRTETLRRHPNLRTSVTRGMELKAVMPAGTAAFLHYFGSLVNAAVTDHFLDSVRDGANLRPEDPAFIYRETLLRRANDGRHSGHRGQHNKDVHVALGVKALNAYLLGTSIKQLRMSKREEFPRVIERVDAPATPTHAYCQ